MGRSAVPGQNSPRWYAPFVIPTTPCEPADVCCVSVYDIAAYLLSETFDAITECYPKECDPLAAYVTMSGTDDGIKDALTVAIVSIVGSPNTRPGGFGLWRATFNVALRESGWPTARIDGETIVLPQPVEQATAAQHVYSMGEALHRRLAFLMSNHRLVPSETACTAATLGSMVPLNPQGGVAGWQIPVIVDLPWN